MAKVGGRTTSAPAPKLKQKAKKAKKMGYESMRKKVFGLKA